MFERCTYLFAGLYTGEIIIAVKVCLSYRFIDAYMFPGICAAHAGIISKSIPGKNVIFT